MTKTKKRGKVTRTKKRATKIPAKERARLGVKTGIRAGGYNPG
jgi:hypothetical protein